MNFAEGAKRVYIAFSCLLLIFGLWVGFAEMPSREKVGFEYYYKLREGITSDLNRLENTNRKEYEISWGDKSSYQFVDDYCTNMPTSWTKSKAVCSSYFEQKTNLSQAKIYYLLQVIGIALVSVFLATILWLALAWIGRGFVHK